MPAVCCCFILFGSDDKGEATDLAKAFEETKMPLADQVKICSTKKIPYKILEVRVSPHAQSSVIDDLIVE